LKPIEENGKVEVLQSQILELELRKKALELLTKKIEPKVNSRLKM
jgi:hypothetical protein